MADRVAVLGMGAASPLGFDATALDLEGAALSVAADLVDSHGEVLAGQVGAIPEARDAGDRRSHKLMSRGARLAAVAARSCLAGAGIESCDEVGFFLGVGASAAHTSELVAVLRASYEAGDVSMAKLGSKGLRAFNPLRTFMLLPNFTMCHAALLEGTTGPNGTYFSRGTGTVIALMEAVHAVRSGQCGRALAGGADSALHPLLWAELARDGLVAEGLVPGEGSAVLVLGPSEAGRDVLAEVASVAIHPARSRGMAAAIDRALQSIDGEVGVCVLAPWGPGPRSILRERVRARWPGSRLLDSTEAMGDALAATPALAWVVAINELRTASRALVLSAGIDGDLGAVLFERGGAA